MDSNRPVQQTELILFMATGMVIVDKQTGYNTNGLIITRFKVYPFIGSPTAVVLHNRLLQLSNIGKTMLGYLLVPLIRY